MRLEFGVMTLLVALLANAAFGQESTREDFEEHCRVMAGRWVAELTLAADWPGLGKKGDKMTAYAENKIIADGNALSRKFYAGDGVGEGMTVYDTATKQIKGVTVSSGGSVFHMVAFKKDGKWVQVTTGSNPDGAEIKGIGTLTVSDDGTTHSWTRGTTVAGVEIPERTTVWKRVGE